MPSLLIDVPTPIPLKAISPFFDRTVPELRNIPALPVPALPVPALPVPVNVTFHASAVRIEVWIGGTGVGVGGAGRLSTYIPWFKVPIPPPVPVRLTFPEEA